MHKLRKIHSPRPGHQLHVADEMWHTILYSGTHASILVAPHNLLICRLRSTSPILVAIIAPSWLKIKFVPFIEKWSLLNTYLLTISVAMMTLSKEPEQQLRRSRKILDFA